MFAGDDGVARRKPLRRQNIGELAVFVFNERDKAGTVGVIFEPLDLGRHIELPALEIDLTVGLLVAAAAVARSDVTIIVAAAGRVLPLGERLDRLSRMQAGAIDQHQLALRRRNGIVGF
jgi:hypothetical protein